MHVRFSTVVGLPIHEDSGRIPVALLSGVLLQPDTGKIEGFFVRVPAFLRTEEMFLSTMDILHWGKVIRIRSEDVLAPVEDIVRIQALLDEKRPMLGQAIRTESGTELGTCKDVQFNTQSFMLEWLFSKKFFRWQPPIPVSAVVLVTPECITVSDTILNPEEEASPSVLDAIDPLRSSGVTGAVQRSKTNS